VAFVVLTAASTLVSVDIGQSIFGEPYQYQGLVTVLLYVGGFYAARVTLRTRERFRALALTHVAVGGIVAGYAIAQTVGFDPFWSGPPEERAISSVGQANDLAAYLDLVMVLGLSAWVGSRREIRAVIAVVLGLSTIGLALTLSRGGFLALGAVGVILLVFAWRRLTRRPMPSIRAAILMTLVVLAGVAMAGPSVMRVVDRVASTGDLEEGSIQMHLDSWRVGLAVASDRPLLGAGPETFPLVFTDYLDGVLAEDRATYLRRFRLESPHNEWIGIAAESGVPALIAYLGFLGALAVRFLRRAALASSPSRTVALTGLCALVIHVVTTGFKTPETSTSLLFWVVVGSALAVSTLTGDEDQAATGSPVDATRSTRSAARIVPDVDLTRADIAARRSANARSPSSLLIDPVSSRSLNPYVDSRFPKPVSSTRWALSTWSQNNGSTIIGFP
jgi:O-antigen ligase